MMERRRVVVTGLGLVTSLGLGVEESWEKALAGVSGISRLTYADAEKSPVQAVGQVREGNVDVIRREFPEEASREGEKRTLFALWAAKHALEDAGVLPSHGTGGRACSENRPGVVLAAGLGINRLEDIYGWVKSGEGFDLRGFEREYSKVHRESLMRNNSNRPSALIAKKFGLFGMNCTVTTACASAAQAIGIAFRAIRRGDSDMILAGGADSMINPVGLVYFVLLGAAATSQGRPQDICRPFDRKRAGLVMGEGAGLTVLEEESHARKRGARIYAEVAGYGSSLDAYQVTAPQPEGGGAEQAMRSALSDARTPPGEIDYVNAHGTGTKLNDIAETRAIKKVFTDSAYRLSVSSTKSLIGHLMAASGGPEFIFTVLTVQKDEIHPTINLKNPDPDCDLDYVPNVKKAKTVRAALKNSFGFGGQNSSVVVKKYRQP